MTKSSAHTKWVCKYHIVFTPKYRRKIIYHELRKDIQGIIKELCKWKGVEIIEGHMMADHIHLLLSIPPKYSVSQFMGYPKGKSGCEAALYTLLSTVGLLLLGITLNHLWETALLVCVFYINQSIGGGFHASTHLRCFITMAIGVVCFIAALHLYADGLISLFVGGISIAILFAIPLVLHTNKQCLAYKAVQLVKWSRIATCIQGVAAYTYLLYSAAWDIESFGYRVGALCVVQMRRSMAWHEVIIERLECLLKVQYAQSKCRWYNYLR